MEKKDIEKLPKLSPKVQIRYNKFVLFKSKMELDGFTVKDLTLNPLLVNFLAILIAIPVVLVCIFIYKYFGDQINLDEVRQLGVWKFILIYFSIYTLLTIVHELIHGLCWGTCAKDHFKNVEFGMFWKYLTPYCTIQSPLKKWQYVFGTSMPTIILGFIPFVFATLFSSTHMLFFSVGMILGGIGDLLVIIRLLSFAPKNKTISYIDHPYKCGLVAFVKDKETKEENCN